MQPARPTCDEIKTQQPAMHNITQTYIHIMNTGREENKYD